MKRVFFAPVLVTSPDRRHHGFLLSVWFGVEPTPREDIEGGRESLSFQTERVFVKENASDLSVAFHWRTRPLFPFHLLWISMICWKGIRVRRHFIALLNNKNLNLLIFPPQGEAGAVGPRPEALGNEPKTIWCPTTRLQKGQRSLLWGRSCHGASWIFSSPLGYTSLKCVYGLQHIYGSIIQQSKSLRFTRLFYDTQQKTDELSTHCTTFMFGFDHFKGVL